MKTKFGYNANNKKSDWVLIQFEKLSKEQMKHLHEAEQELSAAGISFDTGYDFETKTRDWEFDWSLKGARVSVKKNRRKV